MMMKPILTIASISVLAMLDGYAQNRAPLRATYLNHFRNDDAGGSVSVEHFDIRGGVPLYQKDNDFLAFGARYAFDRYRFEDTVADWGDIRNADIGLALKFELNDRWIFANFGAIGVGIEEGANFNDGLKFNNFSLLEYKWSDRLTIGPGLGISTKVDQGTTLIPVVVIEWLINDELTLGSGPSDVSAAGANLFLEYTPKALDEQWVFTTGVSYSGNTFKLAEDSTSAQSSAEERIGSAYVAVSRQWDSGFKLSLIGGYRFFQSFETFNSSGDELSKEILEDAPYVGISVGIDF